MSEQDIVTLVLAALVAVDKVAAAIAAAVAQYQASKIPTITPAADTTPKG